MRFGRWTAAALSASLGACSAWMNHPPAVLLAEDFNQENDVRYELNYTRFAQWTVADGTVDLVGTPPFDDFLPVSQGMYVDLDGSTHDAGTLESRTAFDLPRGRYQLTFKLAGTPRPEQPANTVIISLDDAYEETITLESYAPLQTYTKTITVRRDTRARLRFQHLGGDNYGILLDDIELRRL
jgi:hypothetical protein